ncbi:MAG: hypothetical protein V3U87_09570 [Methylococcaceae bacterium]
MKPTFPSTSEDCEIDTVSSISAESSLSNGCSPDFERASAASHGERTRGLVVPRRRRAVVLSESER